MQSVPSYEATEVEVVRPGRIGRRVDYIGSPGTIDANPQAFLVDRLYPDARIEPHFHDIDQFQIVVEGQCRMGKKPANPVTFQYADAYTPYGPIVGVGDGFAFFTLRPIASGGFFPMPGNRQHMPGRAGRNIAGRFDFEGPRPAAGQVDQQALIADPGDDGLMVCGLRFGPGTTAQGPASDGGGQYFVVCEGEVSHEGKLLDRHSVIHVTPGEAPPELTAGPEGADVLVAQFDRPTQRPGSDPAVLAARDPSAYRQVPTGSGR
jgi:hypothetical protein